jgi:hypothetical protein
MFAKAGTLTQDLSECRELLLQHIDDGVDGSLTVADQTTIPFPIGRVYYITRLSNRAVRGKHAHKTLEQALFCILGSFELELDDGTSKRRIRLDAPQKGVYIPPRMWHVMRDFSPDCVILVLASAAYDETDYLRNYDEFRAFIAG